MDQPGSVTKFFIALFFAAGLFVLGLAFGYTIGDVKAAFQSHPPRAQTVEITRTVTVDRPQTTTIPPPPILPTQ